MPAILTEAALRAIYAETVDALYAYASRRCGGQRDVAEDVTQETWLRAVRDWTRKGIPENPIGWLTTVARNLMLTDLRRRATIPIDDISQAEVLAAVDNNTVSDSAEAASLVASALEKMPADEAKLLESFHYDRCRTAQLAESYGVSERAIEGRLRRARERLRREIETTLKGERGFV